MLVILQHLFKMFFSPYVLLYTHSVIVNTLRKSLTQVCWIFLMTFLAITQQQGDKRRVFTFESPRTDFNVY